MTAGKATRWLAGAAPVLVAALALAVVFRCAYRYPFSDDWDLVIPIIDGESGLTLRWLWAQHNEHRLPIPKLILIAADTLGGGDFRGGVLANWLMLVGTALLLCSRLRRSTDARPAWSGLMLAAIVLNPANNALRWGVETQFVASTMLFVGGMCAVMSAPSRSAVVVAGLSSILLPLTGGNGVLFAFAAIAGTIHLAARSRSAELRAIASASIAISALVIVWYFMGYRAPANHEAFATRSLSSAAVVFAHLIVAPFGPHASRLTLICGPLAAVALVIAGAALWRSRRARERSGPLVVAVALTMGGTLAVFGTIAFARGARGWPSGLETHYATLGIPLWGMIGVGLFACGRRTLPALICAVATAAFVTDLPTGPSPPYVAVGESFHRDWCAGVSTRALTDRYMQLLFYVDTAETRSIVCDKLDVIRRKPFPAWRCDQRR